MARMSAAVIAVALLALSCAQDEGSQLAPASPTTARPAALPTRFTGEFLQVRKGQPGAGGSVVLGARLTAADRTKADIEFSFTDTPPTQGGRVECGGKTYDAINRLDQSKAATGTIEITGRGTVQLDIQRNIGAVVEKDAPPACDQWDGTWTGAGTLAARRGTFLLVGFHDDKTKTFESTLTLNES